MAHQDTFALLNLDNLTRNGRKLLRAFNKSQGYNAAFSLWRFMLDSPMMKQYRIKK